MKSSAAHPRDGMHEVKECGGCHDGKHAFNVEDEKSCDRCHHEKAGAK
jgi:c(7)-type cytochrome triheme protein